MRAPCPVLSPQHATFAAMCLDLNSSLQLLPIARMREAREQATCCSIPCRRNQLEPCLFLPNVASPFHSFVLLEPCVARERPGSHRTQRPRLSLIVGCGPGSRVVVHSMHASWRCPFIVNGALSPSLRFGFPCSLEIFCDNICSRAASAGEEAICTAPRHWQGTARSQSIQSNNSLQDIDSTRSLGHGLAPLSSTLWDIPFTLL